MRLHHGKTLVTSVELVQFGAGELQCITKSELSVLVKCGSVFYNLEM